MPNKRTEEESRALLDAADALATFANVDVERAEEFRKNHSAFVPAAWWDYQSDAAQSQGFSKHWQHTQGLLREAWLVWYPEEQELLLFDFLRILTSVFDPDDLFEVWTGMKERPALAPQTALAEMLPFHKAVQFIATAPWRAKFCELLWEPICCRPCLAQILLSDVRRRYMLSASHQTHSFDVGQGEQLGPR